MDDFAMACLREVAELDGRLEHTRYWYGQRIERLEKWAREELKEPLRTRFFSIVANGTPDPMESPTSAQNYNGMKARAEKAESELVRLRAAAVMEAATDPRAATRTEVLSDVDPVVLEVWKLKGHKVGAMLKDAQAAIIELQEQLDDARSAVMEAAPNTAHIQRVPGGAAFLRVAAATGMEAAPAVPAATQPISAKPVAMIEAADARELADDLEKLRHAHWSHWTTLENHTAAVAVRHLRLLAKHNAAVPAAGGGEARPERPINMDVVLNMLRETRAGSEMKLWTPLCWDLALYITRLESALATLPAGVQGDGVRMLTDEEINRITDNHNTGRAQGDYDCALAVQRKFCEVNGLTPSGSTGAETKGADRG